MNLSVSMINVSEIREILEDQLPHCDARKITELTHMISKQLVIYGHEMIRDAVREEKAYLLARREA